MIDKQGRKKTFYNLINCCFMMMILVRLFFPLLSFNYNLNDFITFTTVSLRFLVWKLTLMTWCSLCSALLSGRVKDVTNLVGEIDTIINKRRVRGRQKVQLFCISKLNVAIVK